MRFVAFLSKKLQKKFLYHFQIFCLYFFFSKIYFFLNYTFLRKFWFLIQSRWYNYKKSKNEIFVPANDWSSKEGARSIGSSRETSTSACRSSCAILRSFFDNWKIHTSNTLGKCTRSAPSDPLPQGRKNELVKIFKFTLLKDLNYKYNLENLKSAFILTKLTKTSVL